MLEIRLICLLGRKKLPNKEEITVGRNSDSDVVVPWDFEKVSRKHCIIYHRENKVTIKDISRNGTCVNGERLLEGKEFPLKDKDKIKLADYDEYQFKIKIYDTEELKIKE